MSRKSETRARRAAWAKAVDEGRVLRLPEVAEGLHLRAGSFRSYATISARDIALAELRAAGVDATIVQVSS